MYSYLADLSNEECWTSASWPIWVSLKHGEKSCFENSVEASTHLKIINDEFKGIERKAIKKRKDKRQQQQANSEVCDDKKTNIVHNIQSQFILYFYISEFAIHKK